jgi:hypothetical protein
MKKTKEDIQRAINLLDDVVLQLEEAEEAPVLTREVILDALGGFAEPGMLEVQLRVLRDLRDDMRASADSEDAGDLAMTITILARIQALTRR